MQLENLREAEGRELQLDAGDKSWPDAGAWLQASSRWETERQTQAAA
jgi:hypothetical protein